MADTILSELVSLDSQVAIVTGGTEVEPIHFGGI